MIADSAGSNGLVTTASGGTLILTGANTYSGNTTVSAGTLQLGNGTTAVNPLPGGSGNTVSDNGSLVFDIGNYSGNPIAVGNAISGSGSLTQNSSTGGTLSLSPSGSNSYGGGTIVASGVLQLGSAGALPSGTALTFGTTAAITSASLDLNGYSATIKSLAIVGSAAPSSFVITNSNASNNGKSTLTFAASAGASSAFAGALQDGSAPVALAITGGTLNLSGNFNNYSGGTTVATGGTLRVSNSNLLDSATGSGPVSIASGAILSGPGSIGGAVSVAAGGHVAPSGVAGTTTQLNLAGGLTLADGTAPGNGAVLDVNLVSPGQGDVVYVNGNLSLGLYGLVNINQGSTTTQLPTGNYPLIDFTQSLSDDTSSTWSVGTNGGDTGHNYSFVIAPGAGINGSNAFELDVSSSVVSTTNTWTSKSNGTSANWNSNLNWASSPYPNAAGLTVYFGSGSQQNIAFGNNQFTVGALVFNNTTAQYNVGSDGAGSLKLDNNGTGPSVTVQSGAAAASISTNLVLADSSMSTQFNIAGGASLYVYGPITEATNLGQPITLSGGGTLELDGNNLYTGGTTVSGGTLNVAAAQDINGATDGNLGSGPLTINAQGTANSPITSTVNLDNTVAIGSLSGTVSGSGSTATLNINNSSIVTIMQSAPGTFGGAISVAGGSTLAVQGTSSLMLNGATTLNSSSALAVNSGTLTVNGSMTFGNSTSSVDTVSVSGGTLVLNNSAATNIAGAVNVTVAQGATLQLAGSVSALSDANTGNLATITNHGSLASSGKLYVTGPSQSVGVITGTGTTDPSSGATTYDGDTVVGDGTNAANLTATQILQNSLTIGAGSTVTIAPSDPAGGGNAVAAASGAVATNSAAAPPSNGDATRQSDPFTAIQAAIASGAISNSTGQVLENRLAAIERLAATDPDLDASLLESRVLAVLPSSSSAAADSSPSIDGASSLLALDSSALGSGSGSAAAGSAAFASERELCGQPCRGSRAIHVGAGRAGGHRLAARRASSEGLRQLSAAGAEVARAVAACERLPGLNCILLCRRWKRRSSMSRPSGRSGNMSRNGTASAASRFATRRICSSNRKPASRWRYFPDLVESLLALHAKRFVLDGEIVIPIAGRLSFDDLLMRIHPADSRVREIGGRASGAVGRVRFAARRARQVARGPGARRAARTARKICRKISRRHDRHPPFAGQPRPVGRQRMVRCGRRQSRRHRRQAPRSPLPLRRARRNAKSETPPHGRLRGGRISLCNGRTRCRLTIAWPVRREGTAQSRRFHIQLLGGRAEENHADRRAAARAVGVHRPCSGRPEPLEHAQERRVGTAQAAACGGSAIRPFHRRPISPRHAPAAPGARQIAGAMHARSSRSPQRLNAQAVRNTSPTRKRGKAAAERPPSLTLRASVACSLACATLPFERPRGAVHATIERRRLT